MTDDERVLLDPTGERTPDTRARAPRPASLDGLTIGLLDITKPRGDVFLDRVERAARGARLPRRALRQADLHEARAHRPAPRDRAPSATS